MGEKPVLLGYSDFSDAFDFEYGVGILRMPERMYQESEDIAIDETLNPNDEENNYDGRYHRNHLYL